MMTTHDNRAAEDHIDNLNQRIFFMESSRDESPGSLLFFSCLQDLKLIPSLQQLMLQIKNLKGKIFSSSIFFSRWVSVVILLFVGKISVKCSSNQLNIYQCNTVYFRIEIFVYWGNLITFNVFLQ